MTSAPIHDVKSAAAVLADDVICQSFIQSSSTLAYACLLIRRAKYDLASHVLHSLEAKQASRFKDMVFYLQAQIGIETGEHAAVKRRLVPRVHQHPNDMVALSLLETCIYLEFVEWEKTHPRTDAGPDASGTLEVPPSGTLGALGPSPDSMFGNAQAAYAASQAAAYNDTPVPSAPSEGRVSSDFRGSQVSVPAHEVPAADLPEVPQTIERYMEASKPSVTAAPAMAAPATGPGRVQYAPPTGTAQDADFGLFQGLANDVNTQAIALWNPEKGRFKSACRNAGLEPLVAMLPHEVPARIQSVCTVLDAGIVNKICFSFQNMTVTSFHSGSENMGLITGHINQSLLSIVRAENTFRKQAASLAQAQSASAASNRNVEYAPNE
jgi:hypothetical protein